MSDSRHTIEDRELPTAPIVHSLQPLTGRPTSPARALVPADLPVLESFLQQADLDTLITRQPVCAIVGDADPRAIFESVLVSSTA